MTERQAVREPAPAEAPAERIAVVEPAEAPAGRHAEAEAG